MSTNSPLCSKLTASHTLTTDFVVVGGGMAGVCAALAAARNGAKVILIQNRSVLGGNASSEIRMHIVGADSHGGKPGVRETGIMEELRLEDATRNPHRSYSQWDLLLYEKVTAEPNITLLLETTCTAAEVQATADGQRRITAILAERPSTEDTFRIEARWFADCSGDGRLGAEAGADFNEGREGKAEFNETYAANERDNARLGSSIMFMSREYPTPQAFIAPNWIRKFTKDDFRTKRDIFSYEYGYWWFEWGGHLDTIRDNERIRHELLRIALGVWDYVKNSGEHPGSANWALDWVAPIPGKRESRRFIGRRILTEHDVFSAEARPDAVAYGGWPIDLHPIMGLDAKDEAPCAHYGFPHVYGIPYGCYCSRNVENLFFAGRNISATHVAFGSTRVMATCAIGGQAIGTAAALLIAQGATSSAALETPTGLHALQQWLLKDDAFIPGVKNEDPADLARTGCITASSATPEQPASAVIDGQGRDLKASWGTWSSDSTHAWQSEMLPATLNLTLAEPAPVREIHITFDSGLHRELMLSGSDKCTQKIIRGAQPEIAKHYRLRVNGELVAEEKFNYLRKRVHRLETPLLASKVELEILSTHGTEKPRVFEVRCYA
jgi:hypothetical protein